MKILSDIAEIHRTVGELHRAGRSIGFVPTMGALHHGHAELMRRARRENAAVIASVYVNPLQFGPNEDFARYPRPFEADVSVCESVGVDVLLHLRDAQMVPPGFLTYVEVPTLTEHLCGARRPGHFRGVTTIVTKLFNLARPTRAYFGQKDAQQALVLRRMTAELNFPIEVVICPTVREADGLALSSRNMYLSPAERSRATAIYRGLSAALSRYQSGERNVGALLDAASEPILAVPEFRIDYVELADTTTLTPQPRTAMVPANALLAVAAFLGKTRLIDNQTLPAGGL